MSVFFAVGYLVIVFRLFFLQVVQGEDLALRSERNRTQVIFLRAPRGHFFDRNGAVLVNNRPSWSLMYSVPEGSDATLESVAEEMQRFLDPLGSRWRDRLHQAFRTRQMVRLAQDIPPPVAFGLLELGDLFPGARVEMETRREYPGGVGAVHLLGYLGEIDAQELRQELWTPRKPGDLIGKIGLEKELDGLLRGQDGGMVIEVDAVGRLKRIIRHLPYKKGDSVWVTLDHGVQRAAEKALAASPTGRGAVAALDVNTGAILAWASSPPIDPTKNLGEQLQDPGLPFFDRVYRGSYPPASVFKIFTAIAGFETGKIQPKERIRCVGYVMLPDRRLRERRFGCWQAHGLVDYQAAMAQSCDTYFYLLGERIGPDAIADVARQFAHGQTVQDLMPGESAGTVPTPAWKRRRGLGGWSTGDTFNMSIGQGFLTATPLQVVTAMAGLATRGVLHKPYVLLKTAGDDAVEVRTQPAVLRQVSLQDDTWEAVLRSLEGVVSTGTGRAAHVSYLEILGKTGTAENPHGEDHAWFAGFAGYKGGPPTMAFCVFVENGGGGGGVAAPIARDLLRAAFPPPVEGKQI